jgi:hypothetical protein
MPLILLPAWCPAPDPTAIIANCVKGYAFLGDLSADERALAQDQHQRRRDTWEKLKKI